MNNREAKDLIHKMVLGLGDTPKEFETQSIIDIKDALNLAIKALEEIEQNVGLRLLVEWAVQCDFGYDNFPEEYEKYKEKVKDMGYIEGMIYIATKEANNGR